MVNEAMDEFGDIVGKAPSKKHSSSESDFDDEAIEVEPDDDVPELRAYKKAHSVFSGEVVELKENYSKVRLMPNEDMVVDDYNLVNQGFVFSAAHLAAISAVNSSRALITNCNLKFLAPLELGHELEFEATSKRNDMKRSEVKVIGKLFGIKVFEADFHSIKLEQHPLKIKLIQEKKKKVSYASN
jgi:acyl-coenzyme A thioesterase PaaI-like protein